MDHIASGAHCNGTGRRLARLRACRPHRSGGSCQSSPSESVQSRLLFAWQVIGNKLGRQNPHLCPSGFRSSFLFLAQRQIFDLTNSEWPRYFERYVWNLRRKSAAPFYCPQQPSADTSRSWQEPVIAACHRFDHPPCLHRHSSWRRLPRSDTRR